MLAVLAVHRMIVARMRCMVVTTRGLHLFHRCLRDMLHRAACIHHAHAGMALGGDAEAEQANHE